jgi:hypothetical protein
MVMGNSYTNLRKAWIPLLKSESTEKLQDFIYEYPNSLKLTDEHGHCIIHDAAEIGSAQAIGAICYFIENVNVLFASKNALHIAIECKRPLNVIMAFIERGVLFSGQDKVGNTPLHYAAAMNREDIVSALSHYGAPLYMPRWADGFTPMDVAVDSGYGDVALLLLSAGSVPDSHLLWRIAYELWEWDSKLYLNGERFTHTLPSESRRRVNAMVRFAHAVMDYTIANHRIIDPRMASDVLVTTMNHPELAAAAREIHERAGRIIRQEDPAILKACPIIPASCHIKYD